VIPLTAQGDVRRVYSTAREILRYAQDDKPLAVRRLRARSFATLRMTNPWLFDDCVRDPERSEGSRTLDKHRSMSYNRTV
jgi:hypothetical protein